MEERRLTTAGNRPQQQGQALDLRSLRQNLTTPTTDDMYSVNKKSRPGARIARALALESNISTKIIAFGKDKDSAYSHIRGWKGPEENPVMVAESVVIERYDDILRQGIFDAIDNGMYIPTGHRNENGKLITKFGIPEFEFGPDGFPVLKDNYARFQLMRNHLNKIKFAERSTMGKAERNVIFKLLGKDDEGVGVHDEKPTTAETNPEQDELASYCTRIRTLLLKIHDGKKDLASETFVTVAKSLKINVNLTTELTNLNDAKRIFEEIQKQVQKSSPVVEVEAEVDDPEINGPLTAEELEKMGHDQ